MEQVYVLICWLTFSTRGLQQHYGSHGDFAECTMMNEESHCTHFFLLFYSHGDSRILVSIQSWWGCVYLCTSLCVFIHIYAHHLCVYLSCGLLVSIYNTDFALEKIVCVCVHICVCVCINKAVSPILKPKVFLGDVTYDISMKSCLYFTSLI